MIAAVSYNQTVIKIRYQFQLINPSTCSKTNMINIRTVSQAVIARWTNFIPSWVTMYTLDCTVIHYFPRTPAIIHTENPNQSRIYKLGQQTTVVAYRHCRRNLTSSQGLLCIQNIWYNTYLGLSWMNKVCIQSYFGSIYRFTVIVSTFKWFHYLFQHPSNLDINLSYQLWYRHQALPKLSFE